MVPSSLDVLCDWLKANDMGKHAYGYVEVETCSLWHKPPKSFLKCNIDVALFHDINCAGFAAIIRDSHGNFIANRSIKFEGCPLVHECEALALLEAISCARELGFQRVICETDAKFIVDAVDSGWRIIRNSVPFLRGVVLFYFRQTFTQSTLLGGKQME